jgi:hypothetical protein
VQGGKLNFERRSLERDGSLSMAVGPYKDKIAVGCVVQSLG